jgi:hypothetical protein
MYVCRYTSHAKAVDYARQRNRMDFVLLLFGIGVKRLHHPARSGDVDTSDAHNEFAAVKMVVPDDFSLDQSLREAVW